MSRARRGVVLTLILGLLAGRRAEGAVHFDPALGYGINTAGLDYGAPVPASALLSACNGTRACEDPNAECRRGKCACAAAFKMKFFFGVQKYFCFVRPGRPCQPALLSAALEDYMERLQRLERVMSDPALEVDGRAKVTLTFWKAFKAQLRLARRPADWSCESGRCDPKGQRCTNGTSPVLMHNNTHYFPGSGPAPGFSVFCACAALLALISCSHLQ